MLRSLKLFSIDFVRYIPIAQFLSFSLLIATSCSVASVVPYLNFRSSSVNAARELVGWQQEIHRADDSRLYGSMSVTPEYSRSFNESYIARALFGDVLDHQDSTRNCLSFKVQGTKVLNRDKNALLADYFYLPSDFQSIIKIDPQIDTFLVDFNIFLGMSTYLGGLFFRIHAPMTHTRWDLNFCEGDVITGSLPYDPGYFNDSYSQDPVAHLMTGVSRDLMLNNAEEFVFDKDYISEVPGINCMPLRYARMSPFRLNTSKLAEIQWALGWDFLLDSSYHLGLELRGSIPTGNRPEAEFLFEAIAGNGHHTELGLGLTSHINAWESDCSCDSLSFYGDFNITHMFGSRQMRTFDLKNKPLSRYMLAQKLQEPVADLLCTINGATVVPEVQFARVFSPVANFSTLPATVSMDAQFDCAIKMAYRHNDFEWDIGWGCWARSCEKICLTRQDCPERFDDSWSLKGDAFVFGFPSFGGTIGLTGVPLSATQSNATINGGTNNYPDGIDTIAWNQNPGIDEPRGLAINDLNQPLNTTTATYVTVPRWLQVNTTSKPVFITRQDLDIDGARTRGFSQKIFTHFNWTLCTDTNWSGYAGLGGQVEWGAHNYQGSCRSIALTQWSMWIKGGLSFCL